MPRPPGVSLCPHESQSPRPHREPLPPLSGWTTSVGNRNGMADLACSGGAHKAGHRACGLSSAAPPTRSRPSSRESWCGCRHLCRAGGEERTAEPQGVLEKARSPLHRALHAGDARGLCPTPPQHDEGRAPQEAGRPHSVCSVCGTDLLPSLLLPPLPPASPGPFPPGPQGHSCVCGPHGSPPGRLAQDPFQEEAQVLPGEPRSGSQPDSSPGPSRTGRGCCRFSR